MNTLQPDHNPNTKVPVSNALFEEIKIILQQTDMFNCSSNIKTSNTVELLKSMGYSNTKTGVKTLNKFLTCGDICSWLKSGQYDFHYTAKEFLEKLSTALKIDSRIYNAEINRCEKIKNEHEKVRECYIFVNTNFHRTSQPIFSLAFMEGHRRLVPEKQGLIFKTDKQIFDNISKLVKKHYQETHGELPMWGKIDNYLYHHFDGKTYAFDNNGCQLDSSHVISESRATLSIK